MGRRDRQMRQIMGWTIPGTVVTIGLVLFLALAGGPAFGAGSFTFADLPWGASPAEARERLAEQGFTMSETRHEPIQRYAAMNAWLDVQETDVGEWATASGEYLGQAVEADLIFGSNGMLEAVQVRTPHWDGTPAGAQVMAEMSNRFVQGLESEHGYASERIEPFGFIDTAEWSRAGDGSDMQLFVRGSDGFMFFPNHTTVLVVSLRHDGWRGDGSPGLIVPSAGADAAFVSERAAGPGRALPPQNDR